MGDRRMSDDAGQDLRPFRKKLHFLCLSFTTPFVRVSDLREGQPAIIRRGLSAIIRHGTRHTRR